MKVNEILSNGKITLSFEVFPPKTDAQFESVRQATIDVAALKPSYMSVTYGAGGNTRKNTVAIAKGIQDTTGVTTIAHLTCVGKNFAQGGEPPLPSRVIARQVSLAIS